MLYELNLQALSHSKRVIIERPDSLGITEKHVEEFLASHLVELIPEEQLMLIAQERQFQEEADILALDRKGVLFIFELKRWQSSAENLLQVMRYGQKFGRYAYQQLEALVRSSQKLDGTLRDRHQAYFGLDAPLEEERFNQEQRFVVVTNGVDQDTLEAIQYWARMGVKIDSLTYKLYRVGGVPHIQFDTYNPELDLVLEANPGIFVVNTNATYMDHAWRDMLGDGKRGKAAAYYDRKNAVQRIAKGSTVFLYHTGVGVIACGKATGGVQVTSHQGNAGEEFFVPLEFDWALRDPDAWSEQAPRAHEINAEIQSSNRFRQTVFNATPEMRDAIQRLRQQKVPK